MSSRASQHRESIKTVIGGRIKAARLARGWTQQQLAQELGIAVMSISRWERGITRPAAEQEAKLAHLLFANDISVMYEREAA